MATCNRKDCGHDAHEQAMLIMSIGSNELRTPLGLVFCEQHREGLTPSDIITDEGWNRIEDSAKKQGYHDPIDRDKSRVECVPMPAMQGPSELLEVAGRLGKALSTFDGINVRETKAQAAKGVAKVAREAARKFRNYPVELGKEERGVAATKLDELSEAAASAAKTILKGTEEESAGAVGSLAMLSAKIGESMAKALIGSRPIN